MSLKYCLEHVVRNVKHYFGIRDFNMQSLRTSLAMMQDALSVYHFLSAAEDLISSLGDEVGKKKLLYLMKGVHLRHWTVFGNMSSIPDI